jgi:sugar lactone lactonase YvrE
MEPVLVADYGCMVGENPLWNPIEKKLYWVDIPVGRIYRYDPVTEKSEIFFSGAATGGFTFQKDGSLLLFMEKGAIGILRDNCLDMIYESLPGEEDSRFNDVIADPMGGVYCGTMPSKSHLASLYHLEKDGKISKALQNVHLSNGLAFSRDQKRMYYVDSPIRTVYRFDYDKDSGKLSNQSVFIVTPEDEGVPDGMTVDAMGCVWIAKWDGGCVVRYTPEGAEERRIEFPAARCASLSFGGEDYGDIYMTAAGGENKEIYGPGAGALFKVDMRGCKIYGVPEYMSDVRP